VRTARVGELGGALAEGQAGEAAGIGAVEDAAKRVGALTADLAEDAAA